eukprot:4518066-Amphidinium_carterae.1
MARCMHQRAALRAPRDLDCWSKELVHGIMVWPLKHKAKKATAASKGDAAAMEGPHVYITQWWIKHYNPTPGCR